jgi:hypothetical protein
MVNSGFRCCWFVGLCQSYMSIALFDSELDGSTALPNIIPVEYQYYRLDAALSSPCVAFPMFIATDCIWPFVYLVNILECYLLHPVYCMGTLGGVVVKAIRYKAEGRGFDSRFVIWIFKWHNPSGRPRNCVDRWWDLIIYACIGLQVEYIYIYTGCTEKHSQHL